MATAVLDLDFHHVPPQIEGLDGYQRALILIRLDGKPVSRTYLPVKLGRIDRITLREAVIAAADGNFWNQWLEDYLNPEDPVKIPGYQHSATIAICSRDRPEDLKRCLDALMQLPEDDQEVLVIDSCSATEETRQVVAAYAGVRYLREDYPGLNRARNRALREASHAIVIFTDDDAVPDPGWLRAHLRNYADPMVMCTTGLTMPLELETRAQETFEQYNPFARGFERKVYTRINLNPLTVGRVGAGVNMAFRREVLATVGPFDEALDAGTPTHSGGEAEMFSRILASGYRIVYEPGALSWHRHRRTWEELRKAIYGYGVGIYAFWTRKYFYDGELTTPLIALRWFLHDQLPALLRSWLRRPNAQPFDLVAAELMGCVAGPFAYFESRKQLSNRAARGG